MIMSNMVVNTNVLALNAHRALKGTGNMQSKASSRLSSGLRINSAADDAAGLAISEKMRAQIRGLDMASKNAQDSISLVQTAEGGMQEIDNMLQRIRELVVQASNDTNEWELQSGGDRQKIQDEISQLVSEVDSMAGRVEFNKKKLINGNFAATALDSSNGPTTQNAFVNSRFMLDNAITNMTDAKTEINRVLNNPTSSGFGGILDALKSTEEYRTGVITKLVDDAIAEVANVVDKARGIASTGAGSAQASVTVLTNSLSLSTTTLSSRLQALVSAVGAQGTVSVAGYTAQLITNLQSAVTGSLSAALSTYATAVDTVKQATASFNIAKANYDKAPKVEGLFFQVGANAQQRLEMSINSVNSNFLGIGDGKGKTSIDVVRSSGRDITDILTTMDRALSYVTDERSKLGALQNRLEFTIKSLDISSENLSASESRIRDTDMAKEMMNLTRANVLQQAGTSMLAQANQAPQSVLQLLR